MKTKIVFIVLLSALGFLLYLNIDRLLPNFAFISEIVAVSFPFLEAQFWNWDKIWTATIFFLSGSGITAALNRILKKLFGKVKTVFMWNS